MGKHASEQDKWKDHNNAGASAGGSCLWGHNAKHQENKSCAYRWQAHLHAIATKDIYHRYKSVTFEKFDTSAYPTKKGGMYPAHYIGTLAVPKDGDWDVTGPPRDVKRKNFAGDTVTIPKGENFHKDTWPYWNNAHHLIPKGTLVSKIDDETASTPAIGTFVKKALLVAKYNVNEKVNMMFLPQDKEVARILRIPRHLTLMHTDGPKKLPECFDHALYNLFVAAKLKAIIGTYKKAFADAKKKNEKHPEKAGNLDKTKLEKLSKQLFDLIKGAVPPRAKSTGSSLAKIFGGR